MSKKDRVELGAIVKYYNVFIFEGDNKIEGVVEETYDPNADTSMTSVVDVYVNGERMELEDNLVEQIYDVFNRESKEV